MAPYGYVLIDRRTVTPYQHGIRHNIFEELLDTIEKLRKEPKAMEESKQELEPPLSKKERNWVKPEPNKYHKEIAQPKKRNNEKLWTRKPKEKPKKEALWYRKPKEKPKKEALWYRKPKEKRKPVIKEEFRLRGWG